MSAGTGAPGPDTDGVLLSHIASTTVSVLLFSSCGNDHMKALFLATVVFSLQTSVGQQFPGRTLPRHRRVHCARGFKSRLGRLWFR